MGLSWAPHRSALRCLLAGFNKHACLASSFLIEKNVQESDLDDLLKGLKLVGDYLEKTILKPNNLNYPISRREFITNLK